MKLLALDLGRKRTGTAYADSDADFVMALDTITHTSDEELVENVKRIIEEKKIESIAIGIPKLLSGEEGSQSEYSRTLGEKIRHETGLPVTYIDERFTSHGAEKGTEDAKAACEIAQIALQRA